MQGVNKKESIRYSIIIPAFNEGENLALFLDEIRRKLDDKLQMEVIVVDDGSSDATYVVARESGAKVIRLETNKGYGEALRTGFRHASSPIIVVLDANGEYDPNQVVEGVSLITNGKADIAVGSRVYTEDSTIRRFVAFQLSFLVRFMTKLKITDIRSNFLCIRKEILTNLKLTEKGFTIGIELLLKANEKNYRIVEFPVKPRRRLGEDVPTVAQIVRSGLIFERTLLRNMVLEGK
jgi:glycosyltransferase involved in cell wall biosynthesis